MLHKLKRFTKGDKDVIDVYREVSRKKCVDTSLVLLEGAQGKNYNGNMFYLLKEIEQNPSGRINILFLWLPKIRKKRLKRS